MTKIMSAYQEYLTEIGKGFPITQRTAVGLYSPPIDSEAGGEYLVLPR